MHEKIYEGSSFSRYHYTRLVGEQQDFISTSQQSQPHMFSKCYCFSLWQAGTYFLRQDSIINPDLNSAHASIHILTSRFLKLFLIVAATAAERETQLFSFHGTFSFITLFRLVYFSLSYGRHDDDQVVRAELFSFLCRKLVFFLFIPIELSFPSPSTSR